MAARTVPVMPDWLAGQKMTATAMNQVTSHSRFWANRPMFRMRQTSAQSIPNAVITIVTMDTPEYDSDTGRAIGTPWAYTIPIGMSGRWSFTVHIPMASGVTQEHDVFLLRNGSPVVGSQATDSVSAATSELMVLTVPVNAGDVMTAAVFQQTGGAQNTVVGTNIAPTFEGRLESLASP